MSIRQQLADAVNAAAIDGVVATAHRPDIVAAGACWPQWDGTENITQMLSTAVGDADEMWSVFVALPADHPAVTADAEDSWRAALTAALAPVCQLRTIAPITVSLGETAAVPAIQFRIQVSPDLDDDCPPTP